VNTNLHIRLDQASGLLQCVRFAQEAGGGDNLHDLPTLDRLFGLERMLQAAVERLRDKAAQ
jgi:hypothetical protein